MELSKNYDVFKYNSLNDYAIQTNELNAKELKRVNAVHQDLQKRLSQLDEDV